MPGMGLRELSGYVISRIKVMPKKSGIARLGKWEWMTTLSTNVSRLLAHDHDSKFISLALVSFPPCMHIDKLFICSQLTCPENTTQ
jgi:hypothetical protein